MSLTLAEMKFGCDSQDTELDVIALDDGQVVVGANYYHEYLTYRLTLGQTIQLRDFLNRHIDELALKQSGSLAVRSSDDPTQLAAVEVMDDALWAPSVRGCGRPLLAPVGHARDCGSYADGSHVFPTLCKQCREYSQRFTRGPGPEEMGR